MEKTDEEIRQDIENQLALDPRVNSGNIYVEVKEGKVILRGIVPDYLAKRFATDNAWIAGVKSVHNHLRINPPYETLPSDDELRLNIRALLFSEGDLDEKDISINVNEGNIVLTGNVDAYWKKIKAEELISDISGISSIENKLAVVPTGKVKDKKIAEKVNKSLDTNKSVNRESINIAVEEGIVILYGRVPSWYAHDSVFKSVLNTDGVDEVIDDLEVINPACLFN